MHLSGKVQVIPFTKRTPSKKFADRLEEVEDMYADAPDWVRLTESELYPETASKFSETVGLKETDLKNRKEEGFRFRTRAKDKVKNTCFWLLNNKSKDDLFLWYTFTIPPIRDFVYNPTEHDSIVMSQFSKMLENLRSNWGLKSYLWVAERQKETKTIHFHCVFVQPKNSYLDGQLLNLYWCKLLFDTGYNFNIFSGRENFKSTRDFERAYSYIDKGFAKDFFKKPKTIDKSKFLFFRKFEYKKVRIFQTYDKKKKKKVDRKVTHGQLLRNPVDFKKITNIKSLSIYLAKYLSKGNDVFYCRTNGMSRDLSSLNLICEIDAEEYIIEAIKEHAYSVREHDVIIGENTFKVTTITASKSYYQSEPYKYVLEQIKQLNSSPPPS